MDRGCITYSAFFLAGILAGHFASFPSALAPALLAMLLPLCIITKRRAIMFLVLSHTALFVAGAGRAIISDNNSTLPPDSFTTCISSASTTAREKATLYLQELCHSKESLSTLSALAVGYKKGMDRNLKKAYSEAGAMHILALSGLHTGIVYSIAETALTPLCLLPGGQTAKLCISIIFLLAYSILSGCSPSVVRAATMILVYKIAKRTFRNTGKWDAIALSALITGIIAPQQVYSISFHLSYAAVIGIAALYPTCRTAFLRVAQEKLPLKGKAFSLSLKIWECIAISVCCQIATLPFSLYYFGTASQYFLISNIIAVPLATTILYTLVATILLRHIPALGELSAQILNLLLEMLNGSVEFIAK